MTTPVKICGITRRVDALLAAELGATWVGFVFWPESPRYIEPAAAAEILAGLPPHVGGIGVFVNQTPGEVNGAADRVGLGAVQLHGDESVADCAACRRRVIKAVRLSAGSAADDLEAVWAGATVLLDAFDPVRWGGTGRQVDWTAAARIARRRPTILSGGLRADNVGDAIRRVAPYGIDVSSGVEAEPGIKDAGRMHAFFEAVRLATADAVAGPAAAGGGQAGR